METIKITFSITSILLEKLDIVAKKRGLKRSTLIIMAIENLINNEND